MRADRITPVGLPVLMMMPSSTRKVSGAQLTRTHPVRSFPLKSGTNPSLSAAGPEAHPRAKDKARIVSRRMNVSLERAEGMLPVFQRERRPAAGQMGRVDGQDHLERGSRLDDVDRRA